MQLTVHADLLPPRNLYFGPRLLMFTVVDPSRAAHRCHSQSAYCFEGAEAEIWTARNHNSRNAALNCGDGILFVVPDNHRAELIHKKRNFVTAITELWCNRHYA